jgi:hypothetical protein
MQHCAFMHVVFRVLYVVKYVINFLSKRNSKKPDEIFGKSIRSGRFVILNSSTMFFDVDEISQKLWKFRILKKFFEQNSFVTNIPSNVDQFSVTATLDDIHPSRMNVLESIQNPTYKTPYLKLNEMNFGVGSERVIFAHPQSIIFSSKLISFESSGTGSRILDGLQLRRIWLEFIRKIITVPKREIWKNQ